MKNDTINKLKSCGYKGCKFKGTSFQVKEHIEYEHTNDEINIEDL